MGRSTIFEQHDVLSAPMRPHHREEGLMRIVIPLVRDQQRDRACPHVEGTVEHTLGPIASHGETHLLPQTTVATR
jgi:hypothetical protein